MPETPNGPDPKCRRRGLARRSACAPAEAAEKPGTARPRVPRLRKGTPGSPAGIEPHQLRQLPTTGAARLTCIDYGPDRVEARVVEDLSAFIADHRPGWTAVRWINLDGIRDMKTIQALAEKYDLHPLAIEDLLHLPQRPKVDHYGQGTPEEGHHAARLFIVVRMLQLSEGQLESEQISIFLGHRTLLTFQEHPGDVWDPIRQRIHSEGSQLRRNDADFLCYALLDAIVDNCFPILEEYGDRLESLEELVLSEPSQAVFARVHRLRRELLLFRRDVWPMREVIQALYRDPHECVSDATRTYLRDVYDHAIQIIELCETYREFGTGLTETYMSSLSMRLNEVMKVLTLIGTIFIPLTFLAGVYGMNMPIPENRVWWSYPAFWAVSVGLGAGMLVWFKRRGWL